jgi:hypothetical protein
MNVDIGYKKLFLDHIFKDSKNRGSYSNIIDIYFDDLRNSYSEIGKHPFRMIKSTSSSE